MNPSSETTHATHCIQSSTSSELLHAKKKKDKWTDEKEGRRRMSWGGGAGGENKLNKSGRICWDLNLISQLSDLLASNGIVTKLKIELR